MKSYLQRKELMSNSGKSGVSIFKTGRSQKRKEEWKWWNEEIREVKDFKYLDYYLQKKDHKSICERRLKRL
jgi:hypothetical protein